MLFRNLTHRHALLVQQKAPVLFASTQSARQSRLAVLSLARQPRDVSAAARRRGTAPQQHEKQEATQDETPASTAAPNSSDDPWAALGLDQRVTVRLAEHNIHTPSDVQAAAIPTILAGSNAAVQCYTGSGKTLAYLLPVLAMAVERAEQEIIDAQAARPRDWAAHVGQVQAIIVAPSRELAMQIVRVAQQVLPPDAARAVQQAIGGANPVRQIEALKYHKPLVVVGTPGRLAELSRAGHLGTHKCGILVLDEVDQLLAPHFRDEMTRLHEHVGRKMGGPEGRQTIIVSATATPKVLDMAAEWCPNPVQVFVAADGTSSDNGPMDGSISNPTMMPIISDHHPQPKAPSWGWGAAAEASSQRIRGTAGGLGTSQFAVALPPQLRHVYVEAPFRHRVDAVRRAMHALDAQRVLVFMNFQQRLKDAQAKLASKGMAVGVLHGELTKLERASVLQAFKRGEYRALVVSDVATRGLDIPECDAVFNLELPSDAAHYAHRAGRTGRMGRAGVVVSIVEPSQTHVVHKLTGKLSVAVEPVEVRFGELREKSPDRDDDENKGGRKSRGDGDGSGGTAGGEGRQRRPKTPGRGGGRSPRAAAPPPAAAERG